ncbi:MAG: carboxylesterase family protein [Ardenticatenales bacterium]
MVTQSQPRRSPVRAIGAAVAAWSIIAAMGGGAPTPHAAAQGGDPLVVFTAEGPVRGARDGTIAAWRNIPYALPPVGALRWRAPQPPALRARELDGTTIGGACPQTGGSALRPNDPPPAWSEDCLQLNIWAPADRTPGTSLPVLLWIHGGGLIQGSAVDPLYSGKGLASARNVVVVTINYRLGALGFLVHPAFVDQDAAAPGAGNYGLLDQIAALRWVQSNIAAFGGDPARTAIFGESAGGESVCALLASPLAKGLFSAAIMESGGCRETLHRLDGAGPLSPATDQGVRFAAAAGCDGAADAAGVAACMRAMTPERVLATLPGEIGILNANAETYDFVVDGHALPEPPLVAVARAGGPADGVPFILGANADEGTIFALPYKGTLTAAAYEATVRSMFRADADAILSLYPVDAYSAPYLALADVTGDAGFVCPARHIARARSALGAPTWLYHFTYVTAIGRQLDLGSHHGAEVPFVFADAAGGGGNGGLISPEARAVAHTMQGYWTSQAAIGDPGDGTAAGGGGGASPAPAWTRYDAAGDRGMQFAAKSSMTAGWRAAKCDLWDRVAGRGVGATSTPIAGTMPPPGETPRPDATPPPDATATSPTPTPSTLGPGRAFLPIGRRP